MLDLVLVERLVVPPPANARGELCPAAPRRSEVDRERQYFSLGLGYKISNTMRADVGWMQEQFDDVYSPYIEVANAPIVDEEVIRNRFQIGLTYRL